jgi:competence protein ComEC
MRTSMRILLVVVLATVFPTAQLRTAKTLDIYVMDVEGGNATLFVTPSGESVLVDAFEPTLFWTA